MNLLLIDAYVIFILTARLPRFFKNEAVQSLSAKSLSKMKKKSAKLLDICRRIFLCTPL